MFVLYLKQQATIGNTLFAFFPQPAISIQLEVFRSEHHTAARKVEMVNGSPSFLKMRRVPLSPSVLPISW
jgi:hypothetical protein